MKYLLLCLCTVFLQMAYAQSKGDVHFMTGNLHNSWSREDYQDFYSVAKWLSEEGFRPIINPVAKKSDLIAALKNPNTVAILWNSHGGMRGEVYDTDNKPIGRSAFAEKTKNLRFVLFANCYGAMSKKFYILEGDPKIFSVGWKGETTSPIIFSYLFSEKFHDQFLAATEKLEK